MKNNTSVVVAFIMLTACFSAKLATPSASDVARVSNKFPNYTLANLNAGKVLFEEHCALCHGLRNPTSRNEENWNKIVPRMVKKANRKKVRIDEGQQELILKYLVTMSARPKIKQH
jgi:mono/diheme cytochrome c family protein